MSLARAYHIVQRPGRGRMACVAAEPAGGPSQPEHTAHQAQRVYRL